MRTYDFGFTFPKKKAWIHNALQKLQLLILQKVLFLPNSSLRFFDAVQNENFEQKQFIMNKQEIYMETEQMHIRKL